LAIGKRVSGPPGRDEVQLQFVMAMTLAGMKRVGQRPGQADAVFGDVEDLTRHDKK
jgi:hypothetical protein